MKIFTSNHFRTHSQRETEITPRSRHEPRSPFNFDFESHLDRTLRLHWRTQRPGSHAFDFADFARLRLRRYGTETALIAIEKWLGFDEFDQICVYLLRNCIIYLFGNWENVRNNQTQPYSYSLRCMQNTRKYFPFLKIAFSKNIYFLKNILPEPNTALFLFP